MASSWTFGLLVFNILVIANCHQGHHGSGEVDFSHHHGPVPLPGRKGLLNFILLVPQEKKKAFCTGYVDALNRNHDVDIDYGFGYGPGIELHESGSSSSSSSSSSGGRSLERLDVPDIPDTQLVNADDGWKIVQGAEGDGKNVHGGRKVYAVSLERYCRLFLVTYF